MKKILAFILVLFVVGTLNAQKRLQLSPIKMPETSSVEINISKLSPETRVFLSQWDKYQKEGKSTQKTQLQKWMQTYGLYDGLQQNKKTNSSKNKASFSVSKIYLSVFVKFSTEAALAEAENMGFIINTQLNGICTGMIRPNQLLKMSQIEGIEYIEAARKAKLVLDSVALDVKIDSVKQELGSLQKKFQGKGVIVGVVDVGFDYGHPTFYDIDDTSVYRVKRVWDQVQKEGINPEGYSYGSELITREDILKAQHSSEEGFHATHVSGIAAGSGGGTNYVGIAPKSDLVFVATDLTISSVLDGIKYIDDYARKVKQPCVINLSMGTHVGPHDGTSAFDLACNQLKRNGFLLVGAAGNEGRNSMYLQHTFTANTVDTLMYSLVRFLDTAAKEAIVDMWSDNLQDFLVGFSLIDENGKEIASSSTLYSSSSCYSATHKLKNAQDSILCTIELEAERNMQNQKAHIFAFINASSLNGISDKTLVLTIKSGNKSQTMSTQMWMTNAVFSNADYEDAPQVQGGSTTHTIGELGGTGRNILSVGAYASKTEWKTIKDITCIDLEEQLYHIASFSSKGPSADGRIKPDITAPGCWIASAFNSFYHSSYGDYLVQKIQRNGRTYPFGVLQGTSMASPVVAGVMALWLESDSTLNIDKVKKILSETAIRDEFTNLESGNPNNTWGYGKIDAYNGILKILQNGPDGREPLVLETQDARNISASSAELVLSVINGFGESYGFVYDTNLSIKREFAVKAVIDTASIYKYELTQLIPKTAYYFRAFGIQRGDTVWGDVHKFTTKMKGDTTFNENLDKTEVFRVYPNPNKGEFFVEFPLQPTSSAELIVTDISGKIVQKKTMTTSSLMLNLTPGLYFLQISYDGSRYYTKVVIQ